MGEVTSHTFSLAHPRFELALLASDSLLKLLFVVTVALARCSAIARTCHATGSRLVTADVIVIVTSVAKTCKDVALDSNSQDTNAKQDTTANREKNDLRLRHLPSDVIEASAVLVASCFAGAFIQNTNMSCNAINTRRNEEKCSR